MASNDNRLSAYFPGLVDVCEGDDGQLVFLTIQDGSFHVEESFLAGASEVTPPDREHLPFTLSRASKVLEWIGKDDSDLYTDLLTFLKRFSALDEHQWSVVAHYVFLTYLHDHPAIDYCPFILFYAVAERGKSRTGKTLAYVVFRGIHLSELREPVIFRYSQHLRGTLFFDLMDVSKKAEKAGCEDILLLRAEKGAKCVRVLHPDKGAFKDTVYYDIYGPTIIATNVELHKILDTRCLPIVMPHRPGTYENSRPELALELKERLTAWRARALSSPLPEVSPIEGISGRLWDISKPLLQVGQMVNPQGHDLLLEALLAIAGERSESKKDTLEGHLVGIIKELSAQRGLEGEAEWSLKTGDILAKYNEGRPSDKHVTPQWIGRKLKSLSIRHRMVKGRSEILLSWNEYWTLVEQYGCTGRDSAALPANPAQTLPEEPEFLRDVTGEVESGRVSHEPWDEAYEERAAILEYEAGLAREEAEEEARQLLLWDVAEGGHEE